MLGCLFMSEEKGKKKRKKKPLEEFLPELVRNSSKNFIQQVTDDVDIYKKIRMINGLPENREADEFAAWWSLGKYHLCPEVLNLFYDNWESLCTADDILIGTFEGAQLKMIKMYRLAKENKFIRERV